MRKKTKRILVVVVSMLLLVVSAIAVTYVSIMSTFNFSIMSTDVIKTLEECGLNDQVFDKDGLVIFEKYFRDVDPEHNFHISGRYEMCDSVEDANSIYDDILLEIQRNYQAEIDQYELKFYKQVKTFFVETDREYIACYQLRNKVIFIMVNSLEESENNLSQEGIDIVNGVLNSLGLPLQNNSFFVVAKSFDYLEKSHVDNIL